MAKKILCLLLALACVISLGACKNTSDPAESTGSTIASNQATENNSQTTESTGTSTDSTTGSSTEATTGSDSNNTSGGDTTGSNMTLPTNTDWKEDGVLKILTIGNSFSVDCMEYVYQIAKAAGVEKVKLGNLYQPGFLDTGSLPLDHKHLVLLAVLPKQIFPVSAFGRGAVDHGNIFLHHGAFLNCLGKGCGSGSAACVDHHTAHILVQPVYGENFATQLLLQRCGHFRFCVQTHRLDADYIMLVSM